MLSTLFFYYLVVYMIIMTIGFAFFYDVMYDSDAAYQESKKSCVML
jgi:hypothetical protein